MANNNILDFEGSKVDYSNEVMIFIGTENDVDVYSVSKEEKHEYVLLSSRSIPMSEATDIVRSVIRQRLRKEPIQCAEFMHIINKHHNSTYKIIVI